jgi:hypothetical protein
MDKIFRLTVLIIPTLMWFFFGTMMLVQSSKDFKDLERYTGQVERIWTDISNNIKGRPSDILLFKIQGLEPVVGIYHNTIEDYDFYLERIKPKDVITIYFDQQGGKTIEGYNLHTYQLEKDGEVLLDKARRNRTYRKVGLILYGVGLIFSIGPIWFYRKKMRT